MGEPFGKREIFRKYPDVVDVPQLCEMLGGSRPVSKKTAYRMLNAGKIRAFRIGRSYRIPKVNVIQLFAERNTRRLQTLSMRQSTAWSKKRISAISIAVTSTSQIVGKEQRNENEIYRLSYAKNTDSIYVV